MNRAQDLAGLIEATILGPSVQPKNVARLCKLAKKHATHSVCVNPCYVMLAKQSLKKTRVRVVSVIGFPHGTSTTETKVFEAKQAIRSGADELDMVMNVGMFKAKKHSYVAKEIRSVTMLGRPVKVILETGLLTDKEIMSAARLAKKSGAAFVKNSTGFGPRGATVKDVKLMRKAVGPEMGVKAAGGIRTTKQAFALIKAGATRIGTSTPQNLLKKTPK